MHYYQHNIGDYRRDTIHLSLLEHGIYRQLLDMYYLTECPIPKETQQVFRRLSARTNEEQNSVKIILNEFFSLTEDGWIHKRCDLEISDYKHKAAIARENGKLGGRPKSIPEQDKTQSVILDNQDNNQNEPERSNALTNKPIKELKEKINKKEKFVIRDELLDVTDQTFEDFVALRKAKRAPLSKRAIEQIRSESIKAGITLEDALIECCARGWQSFKAEWYQKAQSPPTLSKSQMLQVAAKSIFGNSESTEKCINAEVISYESITKKLG